MGPRGMVRFHLGTPPVLPIYPTGLIILGRSALPLSLSHSHVQTSSLGPHHKGLLTPWTCLSLSGLLANGRLALDWNTFFWLMVFTDSTMGDSQWTWFIWLSCRMSLANVISNYKCSVLRAAKPNPLIQQCPISYHYEQLNKRKSVLTSCFNFSNLSNCVLIIHITTLTRRLFSRRPTTHLLIVTMN